MKIGNVDITQLQGIVDKAVGLGKEFAGTALNNDNLADQGRAQQEKGTKQLEALRAEVEADKARAEAKAQEQRQKAAAQGK